MDQWSRAAQSMSITTHTYHNSTNSSFFRMIPPILDRIFGV